MNFKLLTSIALGLFITLSCPHKINAQLSDVEVWKLGWRMIASEMEENYELSNLQFDSLRWSTKTIDRRHLIKGLEVKSKIGKDVEIAEILTSLDKSQLLDICDQTLLSNFDACKAYRIEKVENKELQIELIKMYLNDQYSRSNLMTDILDKYNLTKNEVIIDSFAVNTDEKNRARLKEIFKQYGFPTRKMIGKDAMRGIFLMIQHSDLDTEWQKAQLVHIEQAVQKGDLEGQSYAYVYDRIKINGGEKQLYGTQFAHVDPINGTVELFPNEDIENLDKRRMAIGMMPIEMYKASMLKLTRK